MQISTLIGASISRDARVKLVEFVVMLLWQRLWLNRLTHNTFSEQYVVAV